MKYTIHINQRAIVESGLDIGIIEACILEFMVGFSHSSKCRKSFENGKVYYWFSYQIILTQLPILKISKDRVYRYVKNLVEIHLLVPHPNNQKSGQSWFSFSDQVTLLTYGENTEPTVKTPYPPGENTEPPTVKTPDNNNTIYNTTNINKGGGSLNEKNKATLPDRPEVKQINGSAGAVVFPEGSSPAFATSWSDWVSYKQTSLGFRYKTTRSEQIAINGLWTLAGKNELVAIAIINRSIMNGWEGLFPLKEPLSVIETKPKKEKWTTDWR